MSLSKNDPEKKADTSNLADGFIPAELELPSALKNKMRFLEETPVTFDFCWRVHEYINSYVHFCDTKAGFIIVFNSGLLAVFISANLHQTKLSAIAFGFLGLGIILAGWVIKPRFKNTVSAGYIFWESILKHGSPENFWNDLEKQNNHKLLSHLARDLFVLSSICRRKYLWAGLSLWSTIIGAAAGVIGILLR